MRAFAIRLLPVVLLLAATPAGARWSDRAICTQACTPYALQLCESGDKACWRKIRRQCLRVGPKFCQPECSATGSKLFPYAK